MGDSGDGEIIESLQRMMAHFLLDAFLQEEVSGPYRGVSLARTVIGKPGWG